MLSLELPEWIGFLPPELVALMVTTTTMDAGTKLAMCHEDVLNVVFEYVLKSVECVLRCCAMFGEVAH